MEFAAPKTAEVSARKSYKSAAKSVGGKLSKNSWVVVVGRGESFQQNLPNKPVGHVETFLQIFLVNDIKEF